MTETDPYSKMYLEKLVMDNNTEILVIFIAITFIDWCEPYKFFPKHLNYCAALSNFYC